MPQVSPKSLLSFICFSYFGKHICIYILHAYTYIHTIAVGAKRGHESEGEWGGIYGKTWREEMEEITVIIT